MVATLEQLIPPATRAKLKRAQISSRRRASGDLAGSYQTAFRGSGLQFSELREYNDGDEVRLIDWKASARTGRTLVKSFEEERQLKIVAVLDFSPTLNSGLRSTAISPPPPIAEALKGAPSVLAKAVEFTALIGALARQNHDLFGLITLNRYPLPNSAGSKSFEFIPIRAQKSHWQRVARCLFNFAHQTTFSTSETQAGQTPISSLLQRVTNEVPRGAKLFFVSDFLMLDQDFPEALKRLTKQFQTTCAQVALDSRCLIPSRGLVRIYGPPNSQPQTVDCSHKGVHEALEQNVERLAEYLKGVTQECQAQYLRISRNCEDSILGGLGKIGKYSSRG